MIPGFHKIGEFVVAVVVVCSFIYTCDFGSNHNNISNNTITTTLIACVPSSLTIIFVLFYNLVYIILTVGIVQNLCINPNLNILKS